MVEGWREMVKVVVHGVRAEPVTSRQYQYSPMIVLTALNLLRLSPWNRIAVARLNSIEEDRDGMHLLQR